MAGKPKIEVNDWLRYFAPRFILFTLAAGALLRIILACSPLTSLAGFRLWDWVRIFGLGALNDLAFSVVALVPALLVQLCLGEWKYRKGVAWVLGIGLAAAFVYVFFTHSIFDQYGSAAPAVAKTLIVLTMLCYGLRLLLPRIRPAWCHAGLMVLTYVYMAVAVFIAFGEWFFWAEFGVRFNFIAVDYLVYTHEVVGNIIESYPMVPLLLAIFALAALFWWLIVRGRSFRQAEGRRGIRPLLRALLWAACVAGAVGFLRLGKRQFISNNAFVTELQANGSWNFVEAFISNELDYKQFYPLLEDAEVRAQKCAWTGQSPENGLAPVRDSLPPVKKNIVLITIESMSASYLEAYGGKRHLTPVLDSLLGESLVFDRLYAAGNRTVRGLEAVTLCIPPSAGESLVKRPEQKALPSTGAILRGMGYSTRYIYGGDSYFDNMGAFFGANGYEVTDIHAFREGEITFKNIWGVCDDDAYALALRCFDEDAASGKPFFGHIMTISNHRPFTYPEGRFRYEGEMKSRGAGVKYTDFALGEFLKAAREKAWYANTVFVIVADHCASSAGKTSLPLDKYHIPALIHAPGFIPAQRVEKVCSQIDLMPTLFARLHFSYDSPFYGRDILSPDFRERAFMATYQDLGYYADGILTVLSPVRQVRQWKESLRPDWKYDETLLDAPDEALAREAEVWYQSVHNEY